MKHFFTLLCAMLFFEAFTNLTAQVSWTKHPNPVLTPGPSGEWDEEFVGFPSVLFDGSTYHMWYGNYDYATRKFEKIGYATSEDGITWTKYNDPTTANAPFEFSDPVLNPGSPGTIDDEMVSYPSVLLIDNTYHMWYGAGDDPAWGSHGSICHAVSQNGITWTKDSNNPMLDVGPDGTWDDVWLAGPCVVFDGSLYHMWYCAYNGTYPPDNVRIGHATSADPGGPWTKDPGNPVLDRGSSLSWDYDRVDAPSVIFDGKIFHMFYSGGMFAAWRIGYAWSDNGSNWIKYDKNPVLDWGTTGSFDDINVSHCSVILDSAQDTLKMWYLAADTVFGNHYSCRIGYATAPLSILNVPDQYTTIQDGIDDAENGQIVLVDEGTYYENINFKGKAITVASQYWFDGDTSHISKTIIDGSQPTNPDSGSVVYFVSGEDTTSVLIGFTITNGTGTKLISTGSGVNFPCRAGGGIYCFNSGGRFISNKIMNNTLFDDILTFGGGFGAGDFGSNAWIILEENQIMNNMVGNFRAYGGGIGLTCNGKIIGNTISNNSCTATESVANGGGIRGSNEVEDQCILLIENNTITHNLIKGTGTPAEDNWAATGGGISLYGRFKASILSNKISNNQLNSFNSGIGVGGGIFMYLSESGSEISGNIISDNAIEVTGAKYGGGIGLSQFNGPSITSITNNIIYRNSASIGAGIRLNFNNAQIINNTIVNNQALSNGGGIYSQNSNPVVINTIIWGNEANSGPQISGTANIQYSDIQGGYTGTGNIDADPGFIDTLFNLSDTSWCVGNGIRSIEINSNWYSCPNTDYFGNPRPNPIDPAVDMGAIESPYDSVAIVGIEEEQKENVPLKFALFQNYPNPFNPKTIIKFQIPNSQFVTLKIYNLLGQKVAMLVNKKQPAGNYSVQWNASGFASGIYIYQLIATGQKQTAVFTKKLVLLK